MSEKKMRKITAEKLFESIMRVSIGTIKVMQSTMDAAKMITVITFDVLETLKENGVIVERMPEEPTPPTNVARAISPESKIAHIATTIIMQDIAAEELERFDSFPEILEELEEHQEVKQTRRAGNKKP